MDMSMHAVRRPYSLQDACDHEYTTTLADCEFGVNVEWSNWDDIASAECLLRIDRALSADPAKFRGCVKEALLGLKEHYAEGHVRQCERNGTL